MRKVTKTFFLITISIILCSSIAYSQEAEKKFIVFLINRIDLEDIENMDFTKGLSEEYAIGLMNTRAYDNNNDFSKALTMGCGTRAKASYYTSRSAKLNKENLPIYQRRTGYSKGIEEIANLDIARLKEMNSQNDFSPIIGALGNSLKMNNKKISVIGNSDIDEREIRLGVLMGMDEYGLVDYGLIEKDANIEAFDYPYGLKANYKLMKKNFNKLIRKTDLMIFELGDLYRLERYKGNLTDEMHVMNKEKILRDIDSFIENIFSMVDENNTRFLIASPTPSSLASSSGKKLTPVILAGEGINKGILSSGTTRREGIIGNIDIAPYIAAYFNTNTNFFTGKPLYILEREEKSSYIRDLYNDTAFVYTNRLSVLATFATFEIIVSFLAFVVIQLIGKYKLKFYRGFEYLMLSNMAIPIALLILPLIKPDNIYEAFIKITILTIAIIFASVYIRKNSLDSIIFLSGLTCLILSIDIIMNSKLIKMSFLGYDPIIGARYYGIGNEFMGIFVGATLIFATSLLDRYKISKIIVVLIFTVVTIVIGFPEFGANVGGTITAAFAFMFVTLKLYNSKLKFTHYTYIIASIFALIFLIAIADLYFLENDSHLANAIKQINSDGINVVYSIIKRKISMNLKLFGISIWSKVLVSSLIFLGLLFYRPFGIAKRIFNKYENLSIGLLGILIACIVSFSVNDSGVVASATSIIFLAMTLMYLIFIEVSRLYKSQ